MKELDKQEKMGWPRKDVVLLDRITRVGKDEGVEVFVLQWSKEEGFGCVIQGCGYNVAMGGPRDDWRDTLAMVLNDWDALGAGEGE